MYSFKISLGVQRDCGAKHEKAFAGTQYFSFGRFNWRKVLMPEGVEGNSMTNKYLQNVRFYRRIRKNWIYFSCGKKDWGKGDRDYSNKEE